MFLLGEVDKDQWFRMWALGPDYLGFYISFYLYNVGELLFISHLKDDDEGHVSWENKRYTSWKAYKVLLINSNCSTHVNCYDYFQTKYASFKLPLDSQ